jgi:hypothetical protein
MSKIANPSMPQVARPGKSRRILTWVVVSLGGFILLFLGLIAFMIMRMNYVPANLDLSTSLLSDQGLYQISYTPQQGTIRINQIHTWILHVETPDGQPVENAQILVDGDMPQHGHGLPTIPQVTQYLGNGDYQVDGVKFHMPGWWIMEFDISADGQIDHVTFNLRLSE